MSTIAWALALILQQGQELSDTDKRVDELIEKLKERSIQAAAEGFLKQPELSKLMALGPAAYPRLKHQFLTSDDARVQASAGFLTVLHAQSSDSDLLKRCQALSGAEHALVRAVVKSRAAEIQATCVLGIPDFDLEEKRVFDRIGVHIGVGWMTVED